MPESTIKLKSGEVIKLKDNNNSHILRKEKELPNGETRAHIIRALIKEGKAMRCMEIAKACKMSRSRIIQNLPLMIKDGILLMIIEKGNKYYCPQPIFWDNNIIYGMYERMFPFVDEIYDNLETEQMEVDGNIAVMDCIQIALKLFYFEIEKIKKKEC